jgi:hypothetical protein
MAQNLEARTDRCGPPPIEELPAHADGGELFDAFGGECRGSGSLVADPGSQLDRSFLLIRAALAVAAVVSAGCDLSVLGQ